MKLLIPKAQNKEKETRHYEAIRSHVSEAMDASLSPRKVRLLDCVHEGKSVRVEVAQPSPYNSEIVVAILVEFRCSWERVPWKATRTSRCKAWSDGCYARRSEVPSRGIARVTIPEIKEGKMMSKRVVLCATAFLVVVFLAGGIAAGQDSLFVPAPPRGEVWVYPRGVFPDDFYSLWLAVNGVPYASGDLPYPLYGIPDSDPASRPVFIGESPPGGIWTVVLKARRLDPVGDGSCIEGAFTAFNLGLAAGIEITKDDPIPPVNYLLAVDSKRFSTGFGDVIVRRSVEIRGETVPKGQEAFFGYTPNFDPAANPDTNPEFDTDWLPADYPRGSEYETGHGYGIWSTKSAVYGGYPAFHVYTVNVDLSLSDCLLYGQYGSAIRINNGPNCTVVSNVDIRHTYHCLKLRGKKGIGVFSWAINMEKILGGGGKHLIDGCRIDQSPTWQEYYFGANPKQQRYKIEPMPGGHAVTLYSFSKEDPDDFFRLENSILTNCGSHCVVYQQSNLDFRIANCLIDGGYFPITPTNQSGFPDWWGSCIGVLLPSVDPWNNPPDIEILQNRLFARGCSAWGVSLFGCGNGEVLVGDNEITCDSVSPAGYAGGVQLTPSDGVGSNGNVIVNNVIEGTGGWAISVDAYDFPCEENSFVGNDLAGFSTPEAGSVFFGPQANYNLFIGDVGAGVVDLGTGNVIVVEE